MELNLFTNTAPGFYNTTNLKNPELKEKKAKAVRRDPSHLRYAATRKVLPVGYLRQTSR
jgi:hypothetical protein